MRQMSRFLLSTCWSWCSPSFLRFPVVGLPNVLKLSCGNQHPLCSSPQVSHHTQHRRIYYLRPERRCNCKFSGGTVLSPLSTPLHTLLTGMTVFPGNKEGIWRIIGPGLGIADEEIWTKKTSPLVGDTTLGDIQVSWQPGAVARI